MSCRHALRASAAALAAALGACLPVAQADTVYRCADGRYTEQPCPQGQAMEVDDARTAAQRSEAADVARREAALAARLTQEREAREAMPGANAIAIGSARKTAPASPARHPKKHSKRRKPHRHADGAADEAGDGLSAPVRAPSSAAR
jgi:hypothetical protein